MTDKNPPSERPTLPPSPDFGHDLEIEQQVEFFRGRNKGRLTIRRWVPAKATTPCPPPDSTPTVSIPRPDPLPEDLILDIEVDVQFDSIRVAEGIVDDGITARGEP